MTSDFIGFNFLPASMQPVTDIRRGYGMTAAAPDPSTTSTATVTGSAITVDKTAVHGVNYGTPIARLEF